MAQATAPLKHPLDWLSFDGELKRGFASLTKYLPLPLDKGKGIKGIGLHNKNQMGGEGDIEFLDCMANSS